MRIRNTRYQWGAITIALHWIVFLMAATMIATGKCRPTAAARRTSN